MSGFLATAFDRGVLDGGAGVLTDDPHHLVAFRHTFGGHKVELIMRVFFLQWTKKLYNVNNDFIYIMSNAHRFKSCNSLWIITLWTITGFWIYILLCLLLENFPFCIKHYTLIVRTLSVRQTPLSWELFSSRKNLTLPLDICGDLREGMGGDTTWVGLTTGEASLVGGETEQSFSLSRKSTGLRRIMGSYNTKERLPPHHS